MKDIKYINRDFKTLKESLLNFAKVYYPLSYNDFSDAEPGMMFIEMTSYVGDVLSYYTDIQLKETLINVATERSNIINIAQNFGYKPKNITPSLVKIDIYQLLPAINISGDYIPDWRYALGIDSSMIMRAPDFNISFRTIDSINFNVSSSGNPTDVSIYQVDIYNNPVYFLAKKTVTATAGNIKTRTYSFTTPKKYDKIVIPETDIIEILDVIDSDGNIWYEVPYLGQNTILTNQVNTSYNSSYHTSSSIAPNILKLMRVDRRFVTRLNVDNTYTLQFGAGVTSLDDSIIIPSQELIGDILYSDNKTYTLDPTNFLMTNTYGIAPSNTILTIRYTTGGGIESNVPSNTITEITDITFTSDSNSLDSRMYEFIKNSVACNNPVAAIGGKDTETLEEIRQNAVASFAAQNRAVTIQDYLIRTYSMPSKFGSIAKAFVMKNELNNFVIDLYVLSLNSFNQLVNTSDIIKQNLRTYIDEYRMLTDLILIKDAFIVNIGINVDIVILPGYNSNDVILNCISKLKELFDIRRINIGEPIIIKQIVVELDKIEGVQTVSKIEFINLHGESDGYSNNIYDIQSATYNDVIYPSYDPCIFEVKYPNQDIKVKVVH